MLYGMYSDSIDLEQSRRGLENILFVIFVFNNISLESQLIQK